jgi:tRNA (guanine-N7-)-methyltransferase
MNHQDLNFIGTEMYGGRARKFSQKVEKRGLNNIVVFKGDARQFLWEFLYEESVSEFIIMFPDPWPKKRHHKHRLLRPIIIDMLHHRLVPGGLVSVTTDDAPYRDWILEAFAKKSGFRKLFEKGHVPYPDNYPQSLFEKRFRMENRPLYFMQYEKGAMY